MDVELVIELVLDAVWNMGVRGSGVEVSSKGSWGRDAPTKDRLCDRFGRVGFVVGEGIAVSAMLSMLPLELGIVDILFLSLRRR